MLGELITQTDAKGQTINVPLPSSGTSGYDALGRLVKRIDKKTNGSVEETTSWVYDIAANGKGQLEHVEQASSGYIKQYSYDTLGRARTQAVALSATDGGTHYEYLGYYDQYGREYKSFDASGSGVQREFNTQGYLSRVIDMSPAGTVGAEHYKVLALDPSGRVISERIEDAVTRNVAYDTLGRTTALQAGTNNALQNLTYNYHPVGSQYGNLKERIDNNKGLTETFGYDGLNRLTSSVVTGQPAVTVSYDSFGNIKQKSDIGAYSYGVTAGPHALTTVNGSVLTYDLNGNNTGTTGGRQITYNTFDKPTLIARSGYTSSFTYGPDRDYYKRLDGPSGTKTIYLDGVEKVYKADGSYDVRRYVPGGALITQKYNNGGALLSTSKELVLKDHLGSTDVIADSTGALKQAMSFDSWGRRRDAGNWSVIASTVGFDVSRTAQGYTGHEMLDDVDIVHMHGRIYDARWGRMLQADPFIQDKSDSQAHNRFAYVNNNPLIRTDPSGYDTVYVYAPTISLPSYDEIRSTLDSLAQPPTKANTVKVAFTFNVSVAIGSMGTGSTAVHSIANASQYNSTLNEPIDTSGGEFEQFLRELDLVGYGQQVGRKMLDDFVNNNQSGSPGSNIILQWLATEVAGSYTPPDSSSANGVAATVTAAAIPFLLGSGEVKAAKEVTLSRALHGEAAEHAADAIAAGKPSVLTIDRAGAAANRNASIGALDKVPGKHLDEYPPAMFKEGGAGASVRPINPRDNMSAGACIGNACRGLPDGTRIRINVGD